MEKKVIEKTDELIKEILEQGINGSNIENLYKLSKIKHMAKEDMNMDYGRYGNYGRRPGYNSYGRDNYGEYGARGYDMKYRGYGHLDRMADDYGRYMESRSSYGASEETDKSFHYMMKSLEEFIKYLHEEAETPQQKQMLRETIQRSMM